MRSKKSSGPPVNPPSSHGVQSTWLTWGWGIQLLLGMKKVKSREGWLQATEPECGKQPVFGGPRSSLTPAENIEVSKLMGELSKSSHVKEATVSARGSNSKSCPATRKAVEEPPSSASPWLRLFSFQVCCPPWSQFSFYTTWLVKPSERRGIRYIIQTSILSSRK